MKTPAPEPYFINMKGSSAFVRTYKAFKNNFFIQYLPWITIPIYIYIYLRKILRTFRVDDPYNETEKKNNCLDFKQYMGHWIE